MAKAIDVYLEIGEKRTFAGALDWPGWCRSGRDEAAALQALVDYGPRYARAIGSARLKFRPPGDVADLTVAERLDGDAATEFGVPGMAPAADARPFDAAELERSRAVLRAIWRAFDAAVDAAVGKGLRKGPRGGGRDPDKIVAHILDADAGYLRRLGQRFKAEEWADAATRERVPRLDRTRAAVLAALDAGARGELPERGPRGGEIWSPRYYVRRAAWHTLDHAWEIEDRISA